MIGRVAERRQDKRIDIALPVILENATGVTRDVSASGVFFWESGTFFINGESIRFTLERKIATGKLIRICRGIVVRTEPRDNDVGVAVRIIESKTEAVPGHVSSVVPLQSIREQPLKVTQRRDGELASTVETVSRWSKLLRNMAVEACDELQGQEVLKWDIPSIADGIIPYNRRVRVCSVTVRRLGSSVSRLPRRSVQIDLWVYLADSWHGDRTLDKTPLPSIIVRTTSVGGDDRRQEFDENRHTQKSYGDPTEAFEAFLMLAVESAILINLDSHFVKG